MEEPQLEQQQEQPVIEHHEHRTLWIVVGFVVIGVVVLVGVLLWQVNRGVPSNNDQVSTNETDEAQDISESGLEMLPVVLYAEEIGGTHTENRHWPTVRIMRKAGDDGPEILAEVGAVGEYPNHFVLSPDNKHLLINLESKLQILDLTTKELKDLFIPQKQVSRVSYSPDGEQLFIWDQKYAPRDGDVGYYVHLFNLEDRENQILKQGDSVSSFYTSVWRTDNKVLLNELHGEFSRPWYFDLSTNQLVETPGDFASGFVSQSGDAMAVWREVIDDICNDFSGVAPNAYDVIDPVSGEVLGVIDGSDDHIYVVAFSPDDKGVLYRAEKPRSDRGDCKEKPETKYYKVGVPSGQVEEVIDVASVLKTWAVKDVGATTEYDYDRSTWSILVNEQPIITSDDALELIGQFYTQPPIDSLDFSDAPAGSVFDGCKGLSAYSEAWWYDRFERLALENDFDVASATDACYAPGDMLLIALNPGWYCSGPEIARFGASQDDFSLATRSEKTIDRGCLTGPKQFGKREGNIISMEGRGGDAGCAATQKFDYDVALNVLSIVSECSICEGHAEESCQEY